jgi:hypothetical protein
MTITYADLPKPIRSGIVIVDPVTGTPTVAIVMQFNPDSLQRSVVPQAATEGQPGDRLEALRLVGPAKEDWKIEVELDATDQPQIDAPDGIMPQLALLETLVQPASTTIRFNQALADVGTLEITPVETPLTLFTWGSKRVMPVRITELSITEQYFDVDLNPVRATLNLTLHILTTSDLPTHHRGAELYLAHLAQKEALARKVPQGVQLGVLGIGGIG